MLASSQPPIARAPHTLSLGATDPREILHWVGAGRRDGGRLVLVAQPFGHRMFLESLTSWVELAKTADLLILADILADEEGPLPGVGVALLAEKLESAVVHVPCAALVPRRTAGLVEESDVVLFVGHPQMEAMRASLEAELARKRRGPRVIVVYGGTSAEREVSLHSGREVHDALVRRGFDAVLIDLAQIVHGGGDFSAMLGVRRPDVAFLATHGSQSEDGVLQGFLEFLDIPFTGSGVQASAIAMDKDQTKRLLAEAGLPVPKGTLLTSPLEAVEWAGPSIVKPNSQGSTIGLTFVESADELNRALNHAFRYDRAVLVEEWVRGTEISVPVLGDRALPPVEIAPVSGRYDFASKYQPGATQEIIPAGIGAEAIALASDYALRAHRALGCQGATRTDMIVSDRLIVVLEVNTLPGMTSTSLLPNSARAAGIGFDDLVEWMLKEALDRRAQKAQT